MPLRISVVMPSLNQGRFIEQAILSVVDQHGVDVELIVADGGSTDGTSEVLARHRHRIAWCDSIADAGPADALNRGIAVATGDLIGVLNADDFYLPGALGHIVRAFDETPAADVLSGHGYFADEDGVLGVEVFSDRWDVTRFIHGACVLLQPSSFVRREALARVGGFRIDAGLCWDMALWADLAMSGARFVTVDRHLSAFRLHTASITGRADRRRARIADARAVITNVMHRSPRPGDRACRFWYRAVKFATHPLRTAQQRLYFHRTLGRWRL